MDTMTKLVDVVRTVSAKVRADEDTPKSESVEIMLHIDFSDCTLEDVLQFACADRRIAWANGANGRKAIGTLKSGQHIRIKASSPGAKDPLAYVLEMAKAQGMDPVEWLKAETAKRTQPKVEKLK